MEILHGTAVSKGVAYGKMVYFCARKEDFSSELTDDMEGEMRKLQEGVQRAAEGLQAEADHYYGEGRKQEAMVAQGRELLLFDILERGKFDQLIKEEHYSARRAFSKVATKLRLKFEDLEDDFMRERSEDIRVVTEAVLREIGGEQRKFPKLDAPAIVVADELVPGETLCFERNKILAIITNNSSFHSHSSILARIWNIPSIINIEPKKEWDGRYAIVDGSRGILYIDPDSDTMTHHSDRF